MEPKTPYSLSYERKVAGIGLLLFGGWLLYLLKAYISDFLGAVILYTLFKPLFRKWALQWQKPQLAAWVVVLISVLLVALPISGVSLMLIQKVQGIQHFDFNDVNQLAAALNAKTKAMLNIELITAENVKQLTTQLGQLFTNAIGSVFDLLIDFIILFFILYFLFVSDHQLYKWFEGNLPLKPYQVRLLGKEMDQLTKSNAIVLPLLATVQGVVSGVTYWAAGVEEPIFWGILTGIFSFLPMVGTALVWAPVALYLGLTQHWVAATGVAIVGVVVISNIDNVLRLFLAKAFADVHPIITVFGVIIGLNLFGFPGLIFGPLMISWFLILLKLYQKEDEKA